MCECVCYLLPGVLSGSNSSSGISYRGLCSFICTLWMIILFMQKVGATEVACVQGKTVKAGDLVKGFHPRKTHATHPNHLKTQADLSDFLPCSRATRQPSLEEDLPIWQLNRDAFQSQMFFPSEYQRLLHFPNLC